VSYETCPPSGGKIIVDFLMETWAKHPTMHVYHYAPYEPAAFKRLMGRYSTREAEVDRMLRAEVFVDLHAVVKQTMRASVERYSIKDLERFYGFERAVSLEAARSNLRIVERALELNALGAITAPVRAAVEGYNKDDCVSVKRLQAWLEQLRAGAEAAGESISRPLPPKQEPVDELSERARRVQQLVAVLTADVPPDAVERTDEEHGRWLLAHLLEWHRREAKAPWWEFFRLRDLPEDELFDERAAIAGLRLVSRVGGTQRSPVDRYNYPPQETEIVEGDLLHLTNGSDLGTVAEIDTVARTIDIKKRGAQADAHPTAVFAHSVVNADVLADALLRIGEEVSLSGMSGVQQHVAARELLLRRPPHLRRGVFRAQEAEPAHTFAARIVGDLAETVLPIQGPPGAGKTQTGAEMISELVRRGARVGVTAVSHKVIRNLLERSALIAGRAGLDFRAAHKVTDKAGAATGVEEVTDNKSVLDRLRDGRLQVVGGTAWLWARPDAHGIVDVLFVDEAGQMSLANVVAVSQAAKQLVLLGDPQQLEQPQQGSHPEGTNVSALEHLLAGRKTVPLDRGIFLPETWRLAPRICDFTSELFYDGRLSTRPGLERQGLFGAPPFEGSGLWLVPVEHDGNQSASREEVEVVYATVCALTQAGSRWIDGEGAHFAQLDHPFRANLIARCTPSRSERSDA
jgi:hypothetical protein